MSDLLGAIWSFLSFLASIVIDILEAVAFRHGGRGARQRAHDLKDRERIRKSRTVLIGRDGVAVTPLRPGGRIAIDGAEYEAVALGDVIALGAEVRVVEVSPFALSVRVKDAWP